MAFKQDKRLTDWYAKYNKMFFANSLPADVIVGWHDMSKTDSVGLCATWEPEGEGEAQHTIYISTELKKLGHIARLTLIHEMAHVHLYPYQNHGKRFNLEMLRLAAIGAFNGLW